ncbi:MAG: hypothetical protein V4574_12675 [Pseudomonadota bacterium]
MAALIAAAAAFIGACTFVFTVFKSRTDSRRSREISARAAWETYLEMAFDHPTLGRAGYDPKDADAFEKYEWFVSRMLYAAEEVLILAPENPNWRVVIKDQIRFHGNYLKTQGRLYIPGYSPAVRELIKEELGIDA